jgi:hypothetical protein
MSSSVIQIFNDDALMSLFKQKAIGFTTPRDINLKMLVAFGARSCIIRLSQGAIVEITESSTPLQSWDFAIKGSNEGWNKFWEEIPQAGWHDIFALTKRGEFDISGQLQPLMSHLQVIKDVLAIGRRDTK